jgi:4-hydroxy-tetrahydrodipicolinate reductase
MSARLRVVVIGARGRMGQSLLRLLPQFPALELAVAVGRSDDLAASLQGAGLALDFSNPAASAAHVSACVAARVPLLLGTTGLPESLEPALQQAARQIPLLVAANTSIAVSLLLELVQRAARALPLSFDVEICEAHHRDKIDAPSGTALALGAAVATARGARPAEVPLVHGPQHPGPRATGEIAYAVTRGGDLVGEHAVHFFGAGERLTLSHVASDRAVYARGALQAGSWLARQSPGRYQMIDAVSEK